MDNKTFDLDKEARDYARSYGIGSQGNRYCGYFDGYSSCQDDYRQLLDEKDKEIAELKKGFKFIDKGSPMLDSLREVISAKNARIKDLEGKQIKGFCKECDINKWCSWHLTTHAEFCSEYEPNK